MDETKRRESNIEVLRIICLLIMPFQHYISRLGIVETYKVFNLNNNIAHFLRCFGYPALVALVLISGYFMAGKRFRANRAGAIAIQTIVYGMTFLLIGICTGFAKRNQILHSLFILIYNDGYWYVTVYIAMLLFVPFINNMIMEMDKKQYKLMLAIMVLLLFFLPSVDRFNVCIERNGVFTFIALYCVGGYIQRFKEDIYLKLNNMKLVIISAGTLILSYLTYPIGVMLGKEIFDDVVLGMNNIFAFTIGTSVFLLFLNIDMGQINLINKFAGHAFGVYLFHENLIVRDYLWNHLIDREAYYSSKYFVLHLLFWSVSICVAGVLADVILKPLYSKLLTLKPYVSLCHLVEKRYDVLDKAQ